MRILTIAASTKRVTATPDGLRTSRRKMTSMARCMVMRSQRRAAVVACGRAASRRYTSVERFIKSVGKHCGMDVADITNFSRFDERNPPFRRRIVSPTPSKMSIFVRVAQFPAPPKKCSLLIGFSHYSLELCTLRFFVTCKLQ